MLKIKTFIPVALTSVALSLGVGFQGQPLRSDLEAVAQGASSGDRLMDEGYKIPFTDLEKRLQTFQAALKSYQQSQNRSGEQKALNAIGQTHWGLDNLSQAQSYLEQSVKIGQQNSEPLGRSTTSDAYRSLGFIYMQQGQPRKSLPIFEKQLQQARVILEQSAPYDRSANAALVPEALKNLGITYSALKDYSKAIQHFQQALNLGQQGPGSTPEAAVASLLGYAYFQTGNRQAAEKALLQALTLEEEEGTGFDVSVAQQIEDASQQAIQQIEAIYGKNSPQARQILESFEKNYSKAALLENIQNKADLNALDLTRTLLSENADGSTCSLLQKIYTDQKQPLTALEVSERCRARALARRLAEKVNPQSETRTIPPPNLKQIRQIAKNQKATLVQYSILTDSSVVDTKQQESALLIWAIAPSGQVTFRQVDLKSSWTANGRTLADVVSQSRQSIGVRGRAAIVARPSSTPSLSNTSLNELHKLLIEPIADALPKNPQEHVVFLPQGPLFSVPFPALTNAAGTALVEQHTILTAPSIHSLAFTRKRRSQVKRNGNQQVLVVGNPTMPKYSPDPKQPGQTLPSLPGAETEAQQIASLYKTEAIIGGQATETAITAKLPGASIIHLATHGLLDPAPSRFKWQPLLDPTNLGGLKTPGSIALAPGGGQDGLLTSDEIRELDLNAELVVLSACDTGQGTILSDGVVGLSRSLLAAGAPSLLVSLWKVSDEATADLMVAFYQQLESNPDKAQALRQAMLKTRQKHPDPVDWAAFTLVGEAS